MQNLNCCKKMAKLAKQVESKVLDRSYQWRSKSHLSWTVPMCQWVRKKKMKENLPLRDEGTYRPRKLCVLFLWKWNTIFIKIEINCQILLALRRNTYISNDAIASIKVLDLGLIWKTCSRNVYRRTIFQHHFKVVFCFVYVFSRQASFLSKGQK